MIASDYECRADALLDCTPSPLNSTCACTCTGAGVLALLGTLVLRHGGELGCFVDVDNGRLHTRELLGDALAASSTGAGTARARTSCRVFRARDQRPSRLDRRVPGAGMASRRRKRQQHQEPDERATQWPCTHDGCGRVFTRQGELNKHFRYHLPDRPFACKSCPKTFKHSSGLRKHEKSLHGTTRYQCPVCPTVLKRRDNWRAHVKHCHPELTAADVQAAEGTAEVSLAPPTLGTPPPGPLPPPAHAQDLALELPLQGTLPVTLPVPVPVPVPVPGAEGGDTGGGGGGGGEGEQAEMASTYMKSEAARHTFHSYPAQAAYYSMWSGPAGQRVEGQAFAELELPPFDGQEHLGSLPLSVDGGSLLVDVPALLEPALAQAGSPGGGLSTAGGSGYGMAAAGTWNHRHGHLPGAQPMNTDGGASHGAGKE